MSTTVVISNIMKDKSGKAASLVIKGTVGGTAHYLRYKGPFEALGATFLDPTALATAFMNDQVAFAAINTALNSLTVSVNKGDNLSTLDVVYGATACAVIGPDKVTVTATVNSVSTLIILDMEEFRQLASESTFVRLSTMLLEQYYRDTLYNAVGRDYIATFTI